MRDHPEPGRPHSSASIRANWNAPGTALTIPASAAYAAAVSVRTLGTAHGPGHSTRGDDDGADCGAMVDDGPSSP